MSIPGFVLGWLLTLLVEVPCVVLLFRGQRLKMALVCALATTATNVPMNLALARWPDHGQSLLIAFETAATLLEAVAYFIAGRPRDLPRAVVAAALANGLSFGAGLVLLG